MFESNDCFGNVRALERRDLCRRWARRLVACLMLGAMIFGGRLGYRGWREDHLEKQTRVFFNRADYPSAVLVARQLLQLDPDNVTACRVMADTAELAGRSEAISWRQRVLALEPNAPENAVALAATSFRCGGLDLARKVLEGVPPAGRTSAKYYQLAGAIAVSEKKPGLAEEHFTAALKLEPGNQTIALNLATVRLTLPDPETNEKARAELARLAEEPALRLEAFRALAADALVRNSRVAAERWAAQLKSEKNATFSDALLYLETAQGSEQADAALIEAQTKANQSAGASAALITWMNRHGMARAALDWGLSLPKEMAATQPVPLALAESHSFLQDWSALQAWVEGKDWGDYECFRLAVHSHALHHLTVKDRPSMESETVWRAALKAAQGRTDRLAAIARLAEGWGYVTDAEEAWWTIANGNESAQEALEALQRLYKSKQNSHGLLRVAKRALELNPADTVAENNCASLGLLLNGDSGARRLAARLHAEHPDNPAFTATYAFALHLEGKTSEALQAMSSLKEAHLRHPTIAAYYFVLLVESGNMESAHSFHSAANKAALLPEEQQLVTAATRKLLIHDLQKTAKGVAAAERH